MQFDNSQTESVQCAGSLHVLLHVKVISCLAVMVIVSFG